MNTTTLVIVIVVAVVIVVVIGFVASVQARRKRSRRLREQFGPEYDRAVERTDDRRQAEANLRGREKRHQEPRPLDPEQRHEFQERWTRVQHEFVDDPGSAINDADRLLIEVMAARGYSTDTFEQRAEDLSVEHPTLTQRYREAHRISRSYEHGGARTEDLRHAVTSYRSLVDALLNENSAGDGAERQAQHRH